MGYYFEYGVVVFVVGGDIEKVKFIGFGGIIDFCLFYWIVCIL